MPSMGMLPENTSDFPEESPVPECDNQEGSACPDDTNCYASEILSYLKSGNPRKQLHILIVGMPCSGKSAFINR